jgi:hypothetical protein
MKKFIVQKVLEKNYFYLAKKLFLFLKWIIHTYYTIKHIKAILLQLFINLLKKIIA